MKLTKLKLITAIAVTTVAISACSTSSNHGSQARNGVVGADGTQVQTAGLGANSSFSNSDKMAQTLGIEKNTIYFDFDQSGVDPEYMNIVSANAEYLKSHPNARVRLEGNTDPRGSREYNVGLGHRRANQVEERLVVLGVPKNQIVTVSYGQEHLAELGDTDAAYRLDRRVDIVYEVS